MTNKTNPYKKIYKHYIQTHPSISDGTPIDHTPLLFFPSPPSLPLQSSANSRRHDGDAPCVTVSSLTHLSGVSLSLSLSASFPKMKHTKVQTHNCQNKQKIYVIMNHKRGGFALVLSLRIDPTVNSDIAAGRRHGVEVQIWRCGINSDYIAKPFSKAPRSLSQRSSHQSSRQHGLSIESKPR